MIGYKSCPIENRGVVSGAAQSLIAYFFTIKFYRNKSVYCINRKIIVTDSFAVSCGIRSEMHFVTKRNGLFINCNLYYKILIYHYLTFLWHYIRLNSIFKIKNKSEPITCYKYLVRFK